MVANYCRADVLWMSQVVVSSVWWLRQRPLLRRLLLSTGDPVLAMEAFLSSPRHSGHSVAGEEQARVKGNLGAQ